MIRHEDILNLSWGISVHPDGSIRLHNSVCGCWGVDASQVTLRQGHEPTCVEWRSAVLHTRLARVTHLWRAETDPGCYRRILKLMRAVEKRLAALTG